MKNPRKSTGNPVGTLGNMKSVPQDIADLPYFTNPNATPQENHFPEEESFRNFLHGRLPRHKAPQALRERIKIAIQQLPD